MRKENRPVYVADDGSGFISVTECLSYEHLVSESAQIVQFLKDHYSDRNLQKQAEYANVLGKYERWRALQDAAIDSDLGLRKEVVA